MLHFISFILFVVLSLTGKVSADYCYSGFSSWYCSPGQTCGSYYGDCRGLPTYAIITIVSTSILLLSICIRCCVHMNNSKRATVQTAQNPGLVRVQVHSLGNNAATRPPARAPVHNITEEAPPAYDSVGFPTTKY